MLPLFICLGYRIEMETARWLNNFGQWHNRGKTMHSEREIIRRVGGLKC